MTPGGLWARGAEPGEVSVEGEVEESGGDDKEEEGDPRGDIIPINHGGGVSWEWVFSEGMLYLRIPVWVRVGFGVLRELLKGFWGEVSSLFFQKN